MKKPFFSLLGGLVLGLILSFIFFDYQSLTSEHIGLAGAEQTVNEMDVEFIYNALLLVSGIALLIYVIWSLVEMKKDKKFLEDYKSSNEEKNE